MIKVKNKWEAGKIAREIFNFPYKKEFIIKVNKLLPQESEYFTKKSKDVFKKEIIPAALKDAVADFLETYTVDNVIMFWYKHEFPDYTEVHALFFTKEELL